VKDYYSDSDGESDDNPHGFVDPAAISKFKKTKAEQKKQRREDKENGLKEKKHSHNNKKSEFASTTNKEKLKQKPLSMVRPKVRILLYD
jgi:protein SDA1